MLDHVPALGSTVRVVAAALVFEIGVDIAGGHVLHVPGHFDFTYAYASMSQYCLLVLHQDGSGLPLH